MWVLTDRDNFWSKKNEQKSTNSLHIENALIIYNK